MRGAGRRSTVRLAGWRTRCRLLPAGLQDWEIPDENEHPSWKSSGIAGLGRGDPWRRARHAGGRRSRRRTRCSRARRAPVRSGTATAARGGRGDISSPQSKQTPLATKFSIAYSLEYVIAWIDQAAARTSQGDRPAEARWLGGSVCAPRPPMARPVLPLWIACRKKL